MSASTLLTSLFEQKASIDLELIDALARDLFTRHLHQTQPERREA